VTGFLKDVIFEVYALEDITAADGEGEDYYKKDELVAAITTDDTGYARLENLPLSISSILSDFLTGTFFNSFRMTTVVTSLSLVYSGNALTGLNEKGTP